jgi:hypothetical protein
MALRTTVDNQTLSITALGHGDRSARPHPTILRHWAHQASREQPAHQRACDPVRRRSSRPEGRVGSGRPGATGAGTGHLRHVWR